MSATLKTAQPISEVETQDTGVLPRRWTRDEYYRMAEMGQLGLDERVELIRGVIYEKRSPASLHSKESMTPQKVQHFGAIRAVTKTMERIWGEGYEVRAQGPLSIGKDSEPEPDVLVVSGSSQDYDHRVPTPEDVKLLVEVSDTTLRFDQTVKASLYAEAGIAEYWIVNLIPRCLEVYRDPGIVAEDRVGHGYRQRTLYLESESAAPLVLPDSSIRVSVLLPRPMTESDSGVRQEDSP
jgi:Uma2 family endonuclease